MMQKIETNCATENRTLNLDALRSFVTICETKSFRRAAARVHKSPSAVSLQISKLEELLATQLLERDARNVTLTGQGETLLRQARRLLSLNDETLAIFRGSPLAGQISLAAPHDLGVSLVPSLLRRFAEVHPDVQVDVRLNASESVLKSVTDGSVNLALFNDVGPASIPSCDLFSEPLKWLILDGGRAIQNKPLPLAVAQVGCAWRDVALASLQKAGRDYRVAYSSDTSMGQLAALRADLAVAALPLSLSGRDLVEAPSHYDLPELPFTNIRIADDGSELAKAFVALAATDIRAHPHVATE